MCRVGDPEYLKCADTLPRHEFLDNPAVIREN